MALLSLSIKRPSSGFLDVPPSPPQSPPVVAEFSPPSPAAASASPPSDSPPIDGEFLRLPPPPASTFHNGGSPIHAGGGAAPAERAAKKRRKQEHPSSLLVVAENHNFDDPPPPPPAAWNDVLSADQIPPRPPSGQDSKMSESLSVDPERLGMPEQELHQSTSVVNPVQPAERSTTPSPPPLHQSSMSMSSVLTSSPGLQGVLGYPSSPSLVRVAGSGGTATGSDGEGEGENGVQETCPECRKVFKRRVYLQRHMAREHWSTAKVFKCDKCAYETKHQSNLLVHRRTHTGIGLFCHIVGFYSFLQVGELKSVGSLSGGYYAP